MHGRVPEYDPKSYATPSWIHSEKAKALYQYCVSLMFDQVDSPSEETAMNVLTSAHEQDPNNKEILDVIETLILAHFDPWTGFYEKAIDIFEKHLESNPSEIDAIVALFNLYTHVGHKTQNTRNKAAEYAGRLFRYNPTRKSVTEFINWARYAGQEEHAIQAVEEYAKEHPSPRTYRLLSTAYGLLGRSEEASVASRRASALKDRDATDA